MPVRYAGNCQTTCTIKLYDQGFTWFTLTGDYFMIYTTDVESILGATENYVFRGIGVYSDESSSCWDSYFPPTTLINPCDSSNVVTWGPHTTVTIYLEN